MSPGVLAPTRSALDGQTNLALGKPATQSSTAIGGTAVASRAVDGNTNGDWGGGSVTHTELTEQPWWQVDLQSAQPIGLVRVYNRTDCCSDRLSNFRLRVSADGQSWQDFQYPGMAGAQVDFTVNLTARYVRVELNGANYLSLAEVEVYPADGSTPTKLIDVDTAGCSTNVAINNAIGQSFRVSATTLLDKLEIWIKPELYYTTSYAVEVYSGEGTGGTKLATSPSLTMGSQTGGQPSTWYAFSFQGLGVTLQPNQPYTFRLVRLSQYSGAFSECGNVYANGIEYWLGYSSDSSRDVSFRLHGSRVLPPPTPTPPPPAPLIAVDTAGCSTNVAINNAIGQSFRVSALTQLDKIDVWIKPELYYTTSYAVEVYSGEGTGGTKLATSPSVAMYSLTEGQPSTWYGFSFQGLGVTLQPNQPYTFKLVRLSQYSGAFSSCGNVYPDGIQYWLGYSPDSPYDVSFKLHGTVLPPPPPPPPSPIITVDTAGCSMNVAINNAIGQSFQVSAATQLDKIDVWLKPNLYYTTSYSMELYDGEGTGGTKLATSPSLTLGSSEGGTASTWYSLSFQGLGIPLQPNHAYTFKLVRLSTYSGAFSECGNIYAGGKEYWLGYSAQSSYDVSFKLFGTLP